MEAIAGLSLACNIIQVVETAIKIADLVQQIHQSGQTEEHSSLANRQEHLQQLSKELEKTLRSSNGSPLSALDAQLKKIAEDCKVISAKLLRELDKLQTTGGHRDAILKGILAWRKKDDIEKLRLRLVDHERTLNTGLLIDLRQRTDTIAVMQSNNFKLLDQRLRVFIQDLTSGITQCSDLVRSDGAMTRALLSRKHDEIATHIDTHFMDLRSDVEVKAQRDRLLTSLAFPEMNARMNQIRDHEEATFEWLFQGSTPTPWTDFPLWLRSDEKLYWIQGKAGSGKSTLMKFIIEHEKTREALAVWSGHRSVTYLTAGLWLSGSHLQRSVIGVLCTLLHQILSEDQSLARVLLKDNPKLARKINVADWSREELFLGLKAALQHHGQRNSICIFLDGLDELDEREDPDDLLDMILKLTNLDDVKICTSSRPEPFWVQKMRGWPSLRLQDLTYSDIALYVAKRLCSYLNNDATPTSSQVGMHHDLVSAVVYKADGVFLWVRVAVQALLRGLNIQSSPAELYERLEYLPSDLNELYEKMLHKTGSDWQLVRQEAALYFHFCLNRPPTTLFAGHISGNCALVHLMICEYRWRQKWPDTQPNFTQNQLLEACERTRDRIDYVCFGMIEIGKAVHDLGFSGAAGTVVKLSHRTVRDFLLDKVEGQKILASLHFPLDQIWRCFVIAELLRWDLGFTSWTWAALIYITAAMSDVAQWERVSGFLVAESLRRIDQSIFNEAIASADILTPGLDLDLSVQEILCRNHQYQLKLRSDVANNTLDSDFKYYSYLAFDVTGLSLLTGNPYYPCITTKEWTLQHLTDAYKSYVLLCAVDGLYSVKNFKRLGTKVPNFNSLVPALQNVVRKLQHGGADLDVLTYTAPLMFMLSSKYKMVLHVRRSICSDHTSTASPNDHFLTYINNEAMPPYSKPVYEMGTIFVEFSPEELLEYVLSWSLWPDLEHTQGSRPHLEFRGRPYLIVLSPKNHMESGYMLSSESSNELRQWVDYHSRAMMLAARGMSDYEPEKSVERMVLDYSTRPDTQLVEIDKIAPPWFRPPSERARSMWRNQIPKFKDQLKYFERDKTASLCRNSPPLPTIDDSDSDDQSFKSFEV